MIRPVLHILLHFLVPAAVAKALWPKHWWKATLVMSATILVDLDHFLAHPVYDPERCSIGFHPLHTWPAWILYVVMCFFPKTRWVGIGLVIHMLLDGLDCVWMKC